MIRKLVILGGCEPQRSSEFRARYWMGRQKSATSQTERNSFDKPLFRCEDPLPVQIRAVSLGHDLSGVLSQLLCLRQKLEPFEHLWISLGFYLQTFFLT